MIVIAKISLMFLCCIIYPFLLEKTSVKSKKNHFFIVSSIVYFYPVLIQKNDTGEAQEEINEMETTASSGGGAVSVKVNGKKEIVSLKLSEIEIIRK